MKPDEPMRNINPFGLRLQPDLKAKLEAAAKQNKRSLNAEISARLEASFIPRSMDDIERDSLSKLERELADLSIESFKLADQMRILRSAMDKSGEPEKSRLFEQLADLGLRLGHLEARKHQRLQAVAAIKHFQK